MTSDVVLTSAMRTNLLSLQSTQSNIDKVQNALATGLKVSSALDNPQNFFASESLKNRATDLSRLLDGMGQSIQTIKAADKGATGLTSLLDQAESIANEAATVTSEASGAVAVGNVDLRGVDDVVGDLTGVATGDYIEFTVSDPEGQNPNSTVSFDANFGDGAANRVTLNQYESIDQVMSQINNLRDDDGNQVLKAELDENGFLKVSTLNGGDLRMEIHDVAGGAVDEANGVADAIGFGRTNIYSREYTDVDVSGTNVENRTAITVSAGPALSSYELIDTTTNEKASRTTLLTDLEDTAGNALVTLNDAESQIQISVNGGTFVQVSEAEATVELTTVQDLIDNINGSSTLSALIEADFDEDTGQIVITAKSADAKTIQFAATGDVVANLTNVDLGFGLKALTALPGGAVITRESESIAFGQGAGRLAQLQSDYAEVLNQMNDLVGDSGYRGVNLLQGDTMETFFNEDRSSSLQTIGQDLSTTGLGLKEAKFSSMANINASLGEVRGAKESVRNFSSALANSLTVIQTRETFTKSMISTLTEGSDKLTIADQNEEGAKLLALQTRQQLGVTSLSLASQAQQAVLRLF